MYLMAMITAGKTDSSRGRSFIRTIFAGIERLARHVSLTVGAGIIRNIAKHSCCVILQSLLILKDLQHGHSILFIFTFLNLFLICCI